MVLKFLLPVLAASVFLPGVHAQVEGVSAIAWNGSEFLIGTFDGSLVRYDGKSFQKIGTLKDRILGIGHTKDFWLIDAWKSLHRQPLSIPRYVLSE